MNDDVIPFHILLETAMDKENENCESLSRKLDHKINARTLRNYRAGVTVPNPKEAFLLLDFFNINYSAQELLNSLTLSQEFKEQTEKYSREEVLRKQILLKGSDFNLKGIQKDAAVEVIMRRVENLFGYSKTNFSDYVRHLIEEDVNKTLK